MTVDTRLQRATGIVYAPLGDQGMMLNVDSGNFHSVNDVGVRIWELLEMPQTPGQLRDRLLEEFDVDAPVCEAAVLEFLGGLRERGLIHAAP